MKPKKGAGALDIETLTKPQLRKYHKSICEYYMEHQWRKTLSHFALSPKQASLILRDVRADKANAKVKPKAKKGAAAKAKFLPKGKVTAKSRVVAKALLPSPALAKVGTGDTLALEWLLDYRARRGHGADTVDTLIADFVSSARRTPQDKLQ